MLRSNSKSLGNHVVSPEEEKERLQWEGFAEKECFKPGMKEWVGDGKLIIINMTVSGTNCDKRVCMSDQSCPWVHFVWPDPTQPICWLTKPKTADLDDRRRLRSSLTDALNVPSTHLSTVGDCAFPVAAARVWNSLPATVTSSPSLLTFKRRVKTELFARSYPDC